MNRNTLITLTIVTLILCACPGLCLGAFSGYLFSLTPQELIEQSQYTQTPLDPADAEVIEPVFWGMRLASCLIGLVGIGVPVILGVFALRRSRAERQIPPGQGPDIPYGL